MNFIHKTGILNAEVQKLFAYYHEERNQNTATTLAVRWMKQNSQRWSKIVTIFNMAGYYNALDQKRCETSALRMSGRQIWQVACFQMV